MINVVDYTNNTGLGHIVSSYELNSFKADKQNHRESVLHIKITLENKASLFKVMGLVLRSSSQLTSSDLCDTLPLKKQPDPTKPW